MELLALALPFAAAALAAALSAENSVPEIPGSLPVWLLAAVQIVLCLLTGLAGRRVCRLHTPESRRALTLCFVQLALGFVWPLLFFRAGEYGVAFWWLLLTLAFALAAASSFRRLDRTAGALLVPGIAFLVYAAYLNYAVLRLMP